jgi:hypothetical protein
MRGVGVLFLMLLGILNSDLYAQVKVKKANRLRMVNTRLETKTEPSIWGKETKKVEFLRYDDRGRVNELTTYDRSGDVKYREERIYDGKAMVRKTFYGPYGKRALRSAEYLYNELGLLVLERLYIGKKHRFNIQYGYEEGLLISESWYSARGRWIKTKSFEYTFRDSENEEQAIPGNE